MVRSRFFDGDFFLSGPSRGTFTFHCYAGLGDHLPPEDFTSFNLENGCGGVIYEINNEKCLLDDKNWEHTTRKNIVL
jgi:hypothetical protein